MPSPTMAAMTGDRERYYTIRETAARLRRHWRTIWRWTLDGKISYHQVRPGHKILIPEREINRLRQAEKKGGPDPG